eukprot:284999_1
MLHSGSRKEQNKSTSDYLKYCLIGVQILVSIIISGFVLIGIICWVNGTKLEIVVGDPEPTLPYQSDQEPIIPSQYTNTFSTGASPQVFDSVSDDPSISSVHASRFG